MQNKLPEHLVGDARGAGYRATTASIMAILYNTYVGIYARVSTRSPEQMNSLSAQVSELVRMFRSDYSARIYDVYIDIASGARTENRPAYQRMLEDCRNKNLDLIVCKSISRFGRNTEDMLISLREIKACGVNVFFQLENINTSEASSDTNPALKSIQNRKRMV